ncbi:zinc knuckle CX2CX4HX4C containing protein [Tanacetum coccineum]
MLKMNLLDGTMDEVCYQLLKMIEKQAGIKNDKSLSSKQTATGKEISNPLIADSLLKTIREDAMLLKIKSQISSASYIVSTGRRIIKSRHGFKDIVDLKNGVYFMKFHTDEGLELISNNGPWIVKNKPLIVQKWDINVNLDKTDPDTIPLWVKIYNVPLEAWTVKGISALASRVGKPLVMDSVTASMCNLVVERTGFARVLVEVKANKALPSEIEIVYKNKAKEEICKKSVKCRKNKTVIKNTENVQNISSDNSIEVRADLGKKDSNSDDGFIVFHRRKEGGINEKGMKPNDKPNNQRVFNQRSKMNGNHKTECGGDRRGHRHVSANSAFSLLDYTVTKHK